MLTVTTNILGVFTVCFFFFSSLPPSFYPTSSPGARVCECVGVWSVCQIGHVEHTYTHGYQSSSNDFNTDYTTFDAIPVHETRYHRPWLHEVTAS